MTAAAMPQLTCPKCGGPMFDETKSKFYDPSKNRPIAKCKNKGVCDGVIWPPKGGVAPRAAAPTPVTPINPALNDLPGDPANAYTLPQHQPVSQPSGALTPAMKALYAECYAHARDVAALLAPVSTTVTADTLAAMAATLFIQATRK